MTSIGQLQRVTNHPDPSKGSISELDRFKGMRGTSWTHTLIMVYFRWYPVVSHFNNPPQLDILVPSAHQRLVIGAGCEPCGGHTSSTLMESTMRDTHTALLFLCPPWCVLLPRARWRPLGAGVALGRGQSRAWQRGRHLDLLPLRGSASQHQGLYSSRSFIKQQPSEGHHSSAI